MNESLKPIGHWKKIFLAVTAVVFVALGVAFHVDNSLPGAARVFVEFFVFAGLLFAWSLGAAIIVKGFRWLIGRQAWVIYLKIGVGILSLIVLFYSVEKWRGKRAWTKLKQEVEGRGEKLALSDVITISPLNTQYSASRFSINACSAAKSGSPIYCLTILPRLFTR